MNENFLSWTEINGEFVAPVNDNISAVLVPGRYLDGIAVMYYVRFMHRRNGEHTLLHAGSTGLESAKLRACRLVELFFGERR